MDTLWWEQFWDGQKSGDSHRVAGKGLDYLHQKARSHAANDWAIQWTGPTTFIASKGRRRGACVRRFWLGL